VHYDEWQIIEYNLIDLHIRENMMNSDGSNDPGQVSQVTEDIQEPGCGIHSLRLFL